MKVTELPTLEQLRDGTAGSDQLARAYSTCMAYYRRPCYPHFLQVEEWVGEDRALIEGGDLDAFPRYHRSLLCRALWCLAHEEVLERRAVCARVVEVAALECASDEQAAGNRGLAAVFRSIARRADAEARGAAASVIEHDRENPESGATHMAHKAAGFIAPCTWLFS